MNGYIYQNTMAAAVFPLIFFIAEQIFFSIGRTFFTTWAKIFFVPVTTVYIYLYSMYKHNGFNIQL